MLNRTSRLSDEKVDACVEFTTASVDVIREVAFALASVEEDANGGEASLYNELLYAVESAFPGETRHETALRYIKERGHALGDACRSVSNVGGKL